MRLVFLLLLLAPAAAAQAPDSRAASDTLAARRASRAELYIGGVMGSLVLARAATALLPDDGTADRAVFVAIPAGALLGVVGAGRLAGTTGSEGGAARGALAGGLIGYGVATLAFGALSDGFPFSESTADGLLVLVGVGAAAVLPTVFAARGYTAVPVRVRTPDGTTAPGVALRVHL